MPLTNSANLAIYRRWAPVYDATAARLFRGPRRRAMELLAPRAGERILIVGVGTGPDLPLLPSGVRATGIDLSPQMLARARAKAACCRAEVALVLGDAQQLPVAAGSHDAAILNLILSVVPDGGSALLAAAQAVRPGGRLVVLDKFQPEDKEVTRLRAGANRISQRLGTDLTRRFSVLHAGTVTRVVRDEPSMFRGNYRIILLERT